jgi:hypothetical protein
MAFSPVAEWRAIWLVWSRQLQARYEFWLQIVGFDIRDQSWGHRFYLLYLLLFMAGWAFAMLALLANGTSGLLQTLAPASPDTGAMILLAIGLSALAFLELYQSSRRSPLVFSPEDALLLCQTPVNRRLIALAWFTARWIEIVLPCGLAVLVLESGVVGLQVGGKLEANDLLRYALDGLRGLSLVLPWQTAMLALAWATGAHRLQGDQDRPAWCWVVPLAALILGLGLVWSRYNIEVSRLGQTLLWPFILPLRAAFGQASWLPAMLTALMLAAFGSRAAQETRRLAAQQQARLSGTAGIANELAREDHLGSGRTSAIWPSRPGVQVVMWKDVVQATRAFTFGSLMPWLLLLTISLGAALTPEWGTRVILAAFWILLVGQLATARLRSDLAHWWIWRQLPLASGQLLVVEMARPVTVAGLVTWLGLGAGRTLADGDFSPAMWLVPTAVSSIACAAVFAVLRKCHHDRLLAEQVPESNELGFILGLLCIAGPFGVLLGAARLHWPIWPGVGTALLISLACANGLWRLAVKTHGRIA